MISLEERQMLDKIYSAVDLLDTKNYTIEQLRGYDQFIDNIMIRETDLDEAEKRGKAEGIELGRELASDEMMLIIVDIKKMDLTIEQIAEKYNTSQERVFRLKSLIF
jgi:nitrogen regulatory protein PII